MSEGKRASSIAEFGQIIGKVMMAPAAAGAETPYAPRPSDVIITPYAKSGTTWLQQIFHTLRTGGDMDFDDISRVVPWIERSPSLGIDLNASQRAEPRGFKSHLSWDQVPKGARYIVSIRDPRDVAVSMFRFMEGWWLEPGAIDINEFVMTTFVNDPQKSYWRHLASWYRHRTDRDILFLVYEQMNREPERTVRRVAEFCGIPLDDALLALTLEHSSIEYMLVHKDRFDDAMLRDFSERFGGLPAGSDSAKVRVGKVGSHRAELAPATVAAIDATWRAEIEPEFGFGDYAALVDSLAA